MNNFTFPDSWKDDLRMESLFAPFKPRTVNPSNYDWKMDFWKNLIENWCMHNKNPVVELSVLIQQFRRNEKSPSCLREVMNHLKTEKTLISKEEFDQMLEKSWTKWAVQKLIANPLELIINSVKNMIMKSVNSRDCLLHLPVIKKLGEEVIQTVPENQKWKLLDLDSLKEICEMKSSESLEIVLNHLSSLQLVALHRDNSKILVKFANGKKDNLTITNTDKAVYSLVQNVELLEKNLEKFKEKKKHFMDEARKYISEKNRPMAKMALKRAKIIENVMRTTMEGISNIDSLIYNLEMAELDGIIVDSLTTGLDGLKKFFQENNLTAENISNLKMEIGDLLSLKTDIDEAIISHKNSNVTDEELEKELEILNEEQLYEDLKLPSIPTDNPGDANQLEVEKKFSALAI